MDIKWVALFLPIYTISVDPSTWRQPQKWSKKFYVHDGSMKIICIGKDIAYILCTWWINRNCIYRQKQSKPFYVHDRSMEIINIDNTHSQKRSKTFYVHDGSTAIIYIGKGITNILCPWWINRNHIYWQRHNKYFMSMMDQRKSYIVAKA